MRLALLRFASLRRAMRSFAPLSLAPLRSAAMSCAPRRFALLRSAPVRSAPVRFASERSTLKRCALRGRIEIRSGEVWADGLVLSSSNHSKPRPLAGGGRDALGWPLALARIRASERGQAELDRHEERTLLAPWDGTRGSGSGCDARCLSTGRSIRA